MVTDMEIKEILEKCPLWTEEQKLKINELLDKGWTDVVLPYSEYCQKRNFGWYLLNNTGGRSQFYKEGAESGMTKEQKAKWEKLIKMGWRDVAKAYRKECNHDNMTDDWKLRCEFGWVEGFGMDADEL